MSIVHRPSSIVLHNPHMRILHIIYDDMGNPWLGGGGATRTLEIYSRSAERGHNIVVVCGKYPGARAREQRRGVFYRRVGLSQSYVLSRLGFMVGAARLIKRGGYDIVIEDVSPFSPVASPLWKPKGARAIASVQNLSGTHAPGKYGLAGWGPRLVERPVLSLFTNFVAVSPGIAGQLRHNVDGKINVRVVPNSVDPLFFESGQAEPLQRGDYILSLGRIDVYQKGLDRLVEAFDLFAEQMADVRLLVAGGGTEGQMERLNSLAEGAHYKDRIRILGAVEKAQAARLMRGALCLAMPSRYEAWPLTALEAGAAGAPVAGSDIIGVRDAAPPYPQGHGVLVPEGDTHALAQAFLKLASSKQMRTEIGARGREWAAKFTWDALADQQLAFYEEVIRGNGVRE